MDATKLPAFPFRVIVKTLPASPDLTVYDSYHAVPEARNIGRIDDGAVVTVLDYKDQAGGRFLFKEGDKVKRNTVTPVYPGEYWIAVKWVELYTATPPVVEPPAGDVLARIAAALRAAADKLEGK